MKKTNLTSPNIAHTSWYHEEVQTHITALLLEETDNIFIFNVVQKFIKDWTQSKTEQELYTELFDFYKTIHGLILAYEHGKQA